MSKPERIRIVLDTIGTTAVVITSVVVIWAIVGRGPSEAARAAPSAAGPSIPVDLTVERVGHVMGSRQAKVAIIEFSDFQCPFCATFARDTLPRLKREFVDPGTVQFIYRHNPLEGIHPIALKAGAASYCADQQSRFWEMHDAIFAGQRTLTDASFAELAKSVGLNAGSFSKCIDDSNSIAKVKEDQTEAATFGLSGTPAFLIGRIQPDGTVKITRQVNGAVPYDTLKAALKEIL